jgi:hypothetical protein
MNSTITILYYLSVALSFSSNMALQLHLDFGLEYVLFVFYNQLPYEIFLCEITYMSIDSNHCQPAGNWKTIEEKSSNLDLVHD